MLQRSSAHAPLFAARSLGHHVDLPAVLAALRATGGTPWLLERADGPSLLVGEAALELEVRRHRAVLRAPTPDGGALLDRVRARFAGRRMDERDGALRIDFPPTAAHDAEERLRAASPFDVLRALSLDLPGDPGPFPPFCLGLLGFDHVDMFEDLPPNRDDPLGMPDALFRVPASFLVLEGGAASAVGCSWNGDEHLAAARADALAAAATPPRPSLPPPPAPAAEPAVDLDDGAFAGLVERAKAHVAAGDVFQIVLSRRFSVPCRDPFTAFVALRASNPSPAQFWIEHGDLVLFGASPETAVRVSRDDQRLYVTINPMAGTRPRGSTPQEDEVLEAELRADEKEVAEHMMLVDLGRNDVARVSVPGTRRVQSTMRVERYARVMHLVSTVTGRLRPDLDALHALAAGMNVGTLSGAPKLRATELLRDLEDAKRGPYGGAVGWIAADGRMDSAVVIRSAIVRGGIATVRAGAGVVQDSDPHAEAAETRRKAASVLEAVAAAEAAGENRA